MKKLLLAVTALLISSCNQPSKTTINSKDVVNSRVVYADGFRTVRVVKIDSIEYLLAACTEGISIIKK